MYLLKKTIEETNVYDQYNDLKIFKIHPVSYSVTTE